MKVFHDIFKCIELRPRLAKVELLRERVLGDPLRDVRLRDQVGSNFSIASRSTFLVKYPKTITKVGQKLFGIKPSLQLKFIY